MRLLVLALGVWGGVLGGVRTWRWVFREPDNKVTQHWLKVHTYGRSGDEP